VVYYLLVSLDVYAKLVGKYTMDPMDSMENGWTFSRKEDVDLEFIYDVGLDLSGQMSIQRALDVGSVGSEQDLPPKKKLTWQWKILISSAMKNILVGRLCKK